MCTHSRIDEFYSEGVNNPPSVFVEIGSMYGKISDTTCMDNAVILSSGRDRSVNCVERFNAFRWEAR